MPLVRSLCTVVTYSMRMHSDVIDPASICWHWVSRVAKMADKMLEQDKDGLLPAKQIMHFQSEACWADTMRTVAQIYEHTGMAAAPASLDRIRDYIAQHPRHGATAIRYSMDVLGLSEEAITTRHGRVLAEYRSRFLGASA